jgi:hypothetical protein
MAQEVILQKQPKFTVNNNIIYNIFAARSELICKYGIRAQFMGPVNDELGLAAAFVGTLFILMGQPLADQVASLIVATIIAINAIGPFGENLSFLVGQIPGPGVPCEDRRLGPLCSRGFRAFTACSPSTSARIVVANMAWDPKPAVAVVAEGMAVLVPRLCCVPRVARFAIQL